MTLPSLSGKRAHIWQRISALYLLFYIPFLAWISVSLPQQLDLIGLAKTLLSPVYLLPTLIAIVLVLVHSWVGIRDILMDYTPRARTVYWLWGLRWVLILTSLNIVWVLISLFLMP